MAKKQVIRPTAYILLDKRRVRKDGKKPVRLVVKHLGEMYIWGLNLYLTDVDYRHTQATTITSKLPEDKRKELFSAKTIIEDAIKKARNILLEMGDFSKDAFSKKMFDKNQDTLFTALEAQYKKMVKEGRAGNASSYLCTLNALRLFRGGEKKREGYKVTTIGGKDIPLKDINVQFLKSFEKWFLKEGKSATSIGIYLRNVRVIMNEALSDGKITTTPFGKGKYSIPHAADRKLALTLEDVGKIQFADLSMEPALEKYRDYWIFMYYSGGMNVKDMARLKFKDITVDEISYERAKTSYKKRGQNITIPLTIEAARVIDKWGNKGYNPENYVFPILKHGIDPMKERRTVVDETAKINRAIKKIATTLDIEGSISTYTARHSFATIMKRSGVPFAAISDFMGHSDTKTTENYLAGFEKKAKVEQWANLIPKKNAD
jgi:integrase